jgi:hypothetical protein
VIFGVTAQALHPSEIISSETIGDYQKIKFQPQRYTYKEFLFQSAYMIRGHYLLIHSNLFIVLDSKMKEIYYNAKNQDKSYFYNPTFYFHKNPEKSFIISISDGMEYYFGEDIFVFTKEFAGVHAGFIPFAVPCHDLDMKNLKSVLRLEDKGDMGIIFSFDTDSLIDAPASGEYNVIANSKIQFTFLNGYLRPFSSPQAGDKTIINANSVNFRKQPSVNSPAIARLNVGDVVTVVGKNDEWYHVKFKEQTGYVHSNFLEPVEHEIKE